MHFYPKLILSPDSVIVIDGRSFARRLKILFGRWPSTRMIAPRAFSIKPPIMGQKSMRLALKTLGLWKVVVLSNLVLSFAFGLHSINNNNSDKMADAGTWDEAKLMGVGEAGKGAEAVKTDPMLWGVPGYLTKEEATVFVSDDM